MYQNKETKKAGVFIKGLQNMSKDVINKIQHLSVPLGLYTNNIRGPRVFNDVFHISKLNNQVDTLEVITDDIFELLLNISTPRDKMKTRKNKKVLSKNFIKIKINTKKNRNNTKKKNKPRNRVTKKALKK
jgi:hypothetical protein